MKRARRRFSLYTVTLEDVELFGAWKNRDTVSFTYGETLHFRRARKRNTPLFDALTAIRGGAYTVGSDTIDTLLYEAIAVDFRLPPEVDYIRCGASEEEPLLPAADLPEVLYRRGFSVTGVPGYPETLYFVPFVASASMARESQYLFVNRERLDALFRALTLDMIGADGDGLPFVDGRSWEASAFGGLSCGAKFISVPKLAAYVGLSMSDGASVRELQQAERDAYLQAEREASDDLSLPAEDEGTERPFRVVDAAPDDPDFTPPLNPLVREWSMSEVAPAEPDWQETPLLNLDESNTVCVADCGAFPLQLEKYVYCWHSAEVRWQPRALPMHDAAAEGELNAGARELRALFALLGEHCADAQERETLRAAYDSLTAQRGSALWDAWEAALEIFLRAPGGFVLPEGLIPAPQDDEALTANLNTYAFLYAAAACMPRGECIFAEDDAGDGGETPAIPVRKLKALRQKVRDLRNHPEERSALWNLLHESTAAACRVMEAAAVSEGVRVRIESAPRNTSRTKLSRIQPDSRLNRGQLYDGCGFMSDERFERLETLMRGRPRRRGEEPLNAVQIRLPWCKGLLVRFSFCEFFREWGRQQGIAPEEMAVTDVYGTPRRLFDDHGTPLMQVLFTQSMFKGTGWFGALEGGGDRWAEYWRRLKASGASLHIAGRNTPSAMESQLNYQFLTTLGLTDNELDYLTERRLREVCAAYTDVKRHLSLMTGGRPDEEDISVENEGDEASASDADYENCLAEALRDHPSALLETAFIRDKLDSLAQSEVIELMRGRLPVQGDVRYALPDLMAMSLWIARNLILPGAAEQAVESPINDLSGEHPQGCYYAPGKAVPWQERRTGRQLPVAILRNPHYAVGEEPILSPLPQTLQADYDRWFGGLTGCVMLPASALLTINGADCDGDRVNVCADRAVLRAIRRRAGEENRMLRQVIRRRQELAGWLDGEADRLQRDRRALAEYLRMWARELPGLVPGDEALRRPQMQCSPPLLYAGSEAKGAKFSVEELSGTHLSDKLWEDFCHAREQRIGLMSLQVLDLAADAYAAGISSFEENVPAPELLRVFIARYLVTASALDTALEIDMAKSGLRRADHPLKHPPAGWREMTGLGGGSAFRQWRSVYKRHADALKGFGFEKRLADMMAEAQRSEYVCGTASMPLDRQPMRVFRMWTAKAACLPQRAKGSLKAALLLPRLEPETHLLSALRATVIDYDRRRRADRAVQQLQGEMSRRHQLAMRWLLGNGFPLPQALKMMDMARRMLERWQGELSEKASAALERLEAALRDESLAARWGWVDGGERRRLLRSVLGECSPCLNLTAQEEELLCCSGRSISLVRLVVSCGLAEVCLREGALAHGASAPDALRDRMLALIGEQVHTPACRDEVFFAACRRLYRTTYQDNGRRLTAMNDFTLTYLLRDLLKNRIRT